MEQSNCFYEKQTELYLEKIRLTRWETEAAREKRRKQILLLHQKVQKELENKAVQELMDSKLYDNQNKNDELLNN
jgi:tmRNA-binding protein